MDTHWKLLNVLSISIHSICLAEKYIETSNLNITILKVLSYHFNADIYLYLNKHIICGYSLEVAQYAFNEYPQHMFTWEIFSYVQFLYLLF